MISAYDAIYDFSKRHNLLAIDQLTAILDFIDSRYEGPALLEYLEGLEELHGEDPDA